MRWLIYIYTEKRVSIHVSSLLEIEKITFLQGSVVNFCVAERGQGYYHVIHVFNEGTQWDIRNNYPLSFHFNISPFFLPLKGMNDLF